MRSLAFVTFALLLAQPATRLTAQLQQECPDGSLWEPYSQVCAAINDRRDWWLTPSASAAKVAEWDLQQPKRGTYEPPEPGALNAGTTYLNGVLAVTTSSWLHTKMFVHPEGLNPSDFLGWTFTPATNRVDSAVEVVGIYRTALGDTGVLSIFGRPCSVEYPCPDGDTANGWQPSKYFTELGCNITQIVDQGGHAQKIVHYANHSDRLDDADPPLWKNAVYLWNYCAEEWDLIWQHNYRENKRDCSVEGCYWWSTGFELSLEPFPRPQINELGYEDTLLFHDGVWSELRPDETGFRNPEDQPDLSPWQVFHLDPNRGFGAGNLPDQNDPPVIAGQDPLSTVEDEALTISPDFVVINDPDIDPGYHVAWALTLYGGDNYTHEDQVVTPAANYEGLLVIPITVSDGAADSQTFELQIDVTPVNDAPIITGQSPLETLEGTPLTIVVQDVHITDPDDDATELTIAIQDGAGYLRTDNTITPEPGIVGDLTVTVIASDGELESAAYQLLVRVTTDITQPQLTLLGSAFVSLTVGDAYQDAGATAMDNLDGDISDQIITDNPVNVSRVGTYTVSYSVSDLAGNSASITRTVTVNARPSSKSRGGGGGSADLLLIAFLLLSYFDFCRCPGAIRKIFFATARRISPTVFMIDVSAGSSSVSVAPARPNG